MWWGVGVSASIIRAHRDGWLRRGGQSRLLTSLSSPSSSSNLLRRTAPTLGSEDSSEELAASDSSSSSAGLESGQPGSEGEEARGLLLLQSIRIPVASSPGETLHKGIDDLYPPQPPRQSSVGFLAF